MTRKIRSGLIFAIAIFITDQGARAQSSDIVPMPTFDFQFRVDLGGKMANPFQGPTLDQDFGPIQNYWTTLFGPTSPDELARNIVNFTQFSAMQARVLPKLPALVDKLQADIVPASNTTIVDEVKKHLDTGVAVSNTILDVAMPRLPTIDDLNKISGVLAIKQHYLGFDLNISASSNMIAAHTYRAATYYEQPVIEPYIQTQTNLNAEVEKLSAESQRDSLKQAADAFTYAMGVHDSTPSEIPEFDLSPIKGSSVVDQRFRYAIKVSAWVEDKKLIGDFNPRNYEDHLSQAEEKLIDALKQLDYVPDSEADKEAKDQAEERANLPKKLYTDLVFDIAKIKSPREIKNELAKEIFETILEPTLVGDGQSATREYMKNLLAQQLDQFIEKRFGLESFPWTLPLAAPPSGPEIRPVEFNPP